MQLFIRCFFALGFVFLNSQNAAFSEGCGYSEHASEVKKVKISGRYEEAIENQNFNGDTKNFGRIEQFRIEGRKLTLQAVTGLIEFYFPEDSAAELTTIDVEFLGAGSQYDYDFLRQLKIKGSVKIQRSTRASHSQSAELILQTSDSGCHNTAGFKKWYIRDFNTPSHIYAIGLDR